jgi:GWxTD domain-containing protein
MKFILSIVLFFISLIFSQDIPSTSKGELKFYVDFSAFKGEEGKTYQEFYLMIHADQLNFIGNENKNASFKVSSLIKNYNDEEISKHEWLTDALLNRDSIDLRSLAVYDQWAEILDPGIYKVSVNVTEQEKKISGIAKFNIKVSSFNDNDLSASNIEFITRVEEKKEENHFEKNGRIIIPNPWRRYGLLIPKLSFYYEIYNIQNPNQNKSLSIDYSIINKDDIEVKKLSGVEVKKTGKDLSIIHAIDLEGLNSGIYTLKAEISDENENQKCFLLRNFEIIQIDYLSNNPQLTEEEAETSGKLLEYLATPQEYNIYKNLSLQGKTKFLISFWKEKDPSSGTIENEYLQSIMQRFNYANQNFGWGKIEGYKTDKGRVLIKYGMPDETESYSSEANSVPYEIWTYTKDKRFIFVFGDTNSSGNYILLHSTKEGEISNYNWKDYIRSL